MSSSAHSTCRIPLLRKNVCCPRNQAVYWNSCWWQSRSIFLLIWWCPNQLMLWYTYHSYKGARRSVVGWGTTLQAGRSRDQIPMRWIFFNLPNPSSHTMALGSTQRLTEMSSRNILGIFLRVKADNCTAIYEPIVWKMWEPQHLTTLWASTACYRDTFTLLTYFFISTSIKVVW
jgi:hypothetical protein